MIRKKERVVFSDDGSIRNVLIKDNSCYVEIEEIEAFEEMISQDKKVKFLPELIGERLKRRAETLRLFFFPFMSNQPFMKYSAVSRISGSLIHLDGRDFTEFVIELEKPVYYLETPESEIRIKKIMSSIEKLVVSKEPGAASKYKMGGKPFFEMEVSKFEQIFIGSNVQIEIDDISVFFKNKRVGILGDDGVLSAGKMITNTRQNREMILKIIKKDGLFTDVFSTQVQFTERELREQVVPKMRWGKYFERESARMAISMLVSQASVSQQIFIDVMAKMKGNKEFSKMIKTNKKLKKRFKNDHAILLLMAMS